MSLPLLPQLFMNFSVLVTLTFVLSLTYRSWPPPPGWHLKSLRLGLTLVSTVALHLLSPSLPGGIHLDLSLVPVVMMVLRYGVGSGLLIGLPAALLPLLAAGGDAAPMPGVSLSLMNLLLVGGLTHLFRWTLDMSDPHGSLHRHAWVGALIFVPYNLGLALLPGGADLLQSTYLLTLAFHVLGFWAAASMITGRVSLLQSTDTYREQAHRDALSGLPNRRQFELDLPFTTPGDALLLIDVDHFKQVNDRFGHPVGDEVLRAIGEALAGTLRGRDRAYRYGGEEFAVILRRVSPERIEEVAHRLRELIAAIPFPAPLEHVTVSVGGAPFGPWSRTRTLWDADEALYRVKQEGRNGVRVNPFNPERPPVPERRARTTCLEQLNR
ncbi:GGDEF domain-containing protein [Deinococcus knuensis]|uniref:GGDEF domain-containing protein n=1 Tax=Deinococcus knuensis TaxID=1837380 RepID=A0ABQ2SSS7_9DEIO|nr:GGDEF domain-containing protein [Deinococcus knuensis]GGS35438.1 GGDEF domain-containing protein [Deinococcus knuensis]